MLLLLVKLFRPQEVRDFWLLQGLGLLQVALGCVLAVDLVFGALLLGYLACALGCLTLFHLCSGARGRPQAQAVQGQLSAVWCLLTPAACLLPAAVPAVLLFLALPRLGQGAWEPFTLFGGRGALNARWQTGFSEQIDLNRTGEVEVNEEVALTVTATDAQGEPKPDLPDGQRWRGAVLDYYHGGCWRNGYLAPLANLPPRGTGSVFHLTGPAGAIGRRSAERGVEERLLDLGPRQYFLTFQFQPRKAGGLFLADPVVERPAPETGTDNTTRAGGVADTGPAEVPVLSLRPGPFLFYRFQGTLIPNLLVSRNECHYRQVTMPREDPNLTPASGLLEGYLLYLSFQPSLPRLREWADHLLQKVIARPEYHLTAGDLDWQPFPGLLDPAVAAPEPGGPQQPVPGRFLKPHCWEKASRALTEYLAHSGEYTYSLDLRRDDVTLDPTVDFLCNVKEGHCDRYAGGLALLLRSLGVPCRVVKGFRGQENQGDGTYLVRQSHAHSWVEALVVRPAAGREAASREEAKTWPRYWWALDPTPATDAPKGPGFSLNRFWENCLQGGWTFWRELIVDYSGERQEGLLEDLWQGLTSNKALVGRGWRRAAVLFGLLLVCLAGLVVRRWRRRGRFRPRKGVSAGAAVPFYGRLLAILERRCRLHPQPAQTPREFAAAARSHLAACGGAVADVPVRVAALLYRVRYGREPLTEDERRAVEEQLDRLEAVLRDSGAAGAKVENQPMPA
jgi:hypothetical protein